MQIAAEQYGLPRARNRAAHQVGQLLGHRAAFPEPSPDFVSLLLFERHYVKRLIALGEHDIESRLDEPGTFFGDDARQISAV